MREEEVVRLIARLIAEQPLASGVLLGPGDDCAVLQSAAPLAVTCDSLLDKVHFHSQYMNYEQIGARAMAVNLSDLAAMGAEPCYGLLALSLPEAPTEQMLRQLMGGLLATASAYGLSLVGGDTIKAPALCLSLTLMGKLHTPALRRNQAQPGQQIWVTGPLGLASAGLFALQHQLAQDARWAELVSAHINPTPRIEAGRILAACHLNGAVMDISDGLATDLARICQASGVGAVIREDKITLHPAMRHLAAQKQQDALTWALCGGEDFELLFTCAPLQAQAIIPLLQQSGLQPACLGVIREKPGVYLQSTTNEMQEISFQGFDHFSQ